MKSDIKNIIELTKLDEDETASGEFTKSSESTGFIEKEEHVIDTLKPLPTYEMDHFRNALIPIFNDKSTAILEELSSKNEIEFPVGIFKIIITKGVF